MRLLSPKSFLEYAAEEYQFYVMSLYRERKKVKSERTKKKPKEPKEKKITFSLTKTGKISVKTGRKPKYYTEAEFIAAAEALGKPRSELFIMLKERGFVARSGGHGEK